MFPISQTGCVSYYANQSLLSNPGEFANFYDNLPDEPEALVQIIQGIMIHKLVADYYQVQVSSVQRAEQYLRSVEQRLTRRLNLTKNWQV
jgi:hypothetical protein